MCLLSPVRTAFEIINLPSYFWCVLEDKNASFWVQFMFCHDLWVSFSSLRILETIFFPLWSLTEDFFTLLLNQHPNTILVRVGGNTSWSENFQSKPTLLLLVNFFLFSLIEVTFRIGILLICWHRKSVFCKRKAQIHSG